MTTLRMENTVKTAWLWTVSLTNPRTRYLTEPQSSSSNQDNVRCFLAGVLLSHDREQAKSYQTSSHPIMKAQQMSNNFLSSSVFSEKLSAEPCIHWMLNKCPGWIDVNCWITTLSVSFHLTLDSPKKLFWLHKQWYFQSTLSVYIF
jgi:hypothetical protein